MLLLVSSVQTVCWLFWLTPILVCWGLDLLFCWALLDLILLWFSSVIESVFLEALHQVASAYCCSSWCFHIDGWIQSSCCISLGLSCCWIDAWSCFWWQNPQLILNAFGKLLTLWNHGCLFFLLRFATTFLHWHTLCFVDEGVVVAAICMDECFCSPYSFSFWWRTMFISAVSGLTWCWCHESTCWVAVWRMQCSCLYLA